MGSPTLESFRKLSRLAETSTTAQKALDRVRLRVRDCSSVVAVKLQEGVIRVVLSREDLLVPARLRDSTYGIPVVVEQRATPEGKALVGKLAADMRETSGLVERELEAIGMMFARGPDPSALYRMYSILPADLTTLVDRQHDAIEVWLADYPIALLQTRAAELEREMQAAMDRDNQTDLRNAQVKLRHVSAAIARMDKRGDVSESALTRHASYAKRYETVAKRLGKRGYTAAAEEMTRRSTYHAQVLSDLRKRQKESRKRETK